jgi:DnaJ family protein B protein 12
MEINNNNDNNNNIKKNIHEGNTNEWKKLYTIQQKELVERIKNAKDYYEILLVSKNSTLEEIKKSYKKLALQMHPDKNSAPGAEEAFKKLSQAFACLSDENKRKLYDLYGYEKNSTRFSSTTTFTSEWDSELSPEEIFSMFFGKPNINIYKRKGHTTRVYSFSREFPDHFHYRNFYHYENNNQANDNIDNHKTIWFLLQIILFFLIFSIKFFSLTNEPLFQFSKSTKYSLEKKTSEGIIYYVQPNFKHYDIIKIEKMVKEAWFNYNKRECYNEKEQKIKLMKYAESTRNLELKKKAEDLPTPSCEILEKLTVY